CNDDACPNATGANTASRIAPTVTAGQTYFIVVDGFSGTQGNFTLTVTPPVATTTTTSPPSTTTTSTAPPTTTSTTSTTTTTRPPTTTTSTTTSTTTTTTLIVPPSPTNLTATPMSCSEVDLRWTLSSGSVSGYNVYRKASTDSTFAMIRQLGPTPVFP